MTLLHVGLFAVLVVCSSGAETTYACDRTSSCGCSSSAAVLSRIIGGEPVASLSWSWTVALYNAGTFFCGGSLISSTMIVTGAHCMAPQLSSLSTVTIIAGTNALSNSDGKGQVRHLIEVFMHPDYEGAKVTNDIAIVRVSQPFDLSNSKLTPVCLPNAVTAEIIATLEYPLPGTSLAVVGWGVIEYGRKDPSPSLRQVVVQAVASTSPNCATSTKEFTNVTVQFCAGVPAGGKGKGYGDDALIMASFACPIDACQGDSGGPIMAFVSNRWQLVGIASSGFGCAVPGHSGIYTRVAYFIPFIETVINGNQTKYSSTKTSPSNAGERVKTTAITVISLAVLAFIVSIADA